MAPKRENLILRLVVLFLIVTALTTLIGSPARTVSARSLSWVLPQRIPGYDDDSLDPVLVKGNQVVYAFNTKQMGNARVVIYNQWTPNQGWTTPIDIILTPLIGQMDVLDVYLDPDGIFHMIFYAGDDTLANLYYSEASMWAAGRAQSWSKPVIIGEKAITPFEGQIKRDENGNLVVLYSSSYDGNGIYALYSSDNGRSWSSEPQQVMVTFAEDLKPYTLKMIQGEDNRFHAVWSIVDINGAGQAIYYADKEPNTMTWNPALKLATGIGTLGSDTPAIAEYKGELFVIYHNDFPSTRWMRRSSDGGRTWSDPLRLFQQVGSNGPASMVVDSSNRFYLFFGNRRGDPAIHAMWTTTWQGSRWEEPVAVVSGSRVTDNVGGRGFDPSFANALILQGNLLFLTWRTDPGAGSNGIWFTYNNLASPALPTFAYPTPTPTVELAPSLTPTSSYRTPTPRGLEPTLAFPTPESGRAPVINPGVWVGVSIIPAMLVVTAIVVVLRSRAGKAKPPRRLED